MKFYLLLMAMLGLTLNGLAADKHHVEINDKTRDNIATKTLKQQSNTVLVYARGLVCESCAIGIRKKVQRLKFVDTKQPNKGIVLDPKTQLVTISVNGEKAVDPRAIRKAIKGAGYDPVALYQSLPGRGVTKTSLTK